jgi:hypothetical protein
MYLHVRALVSVCHVGSQPQAGALAGGTARAMTPVTWSRAPAQRQRGIWQQ